MVLRFLYITNTFVVRCEERFYSILRIYEEMVLIHYWRIVDLKICLPRKQYIRYWTRESKVEKRKLLKIHSLVQVRIKNFFKKFIAHLTDWLILQYFGNRYIHYFLKKLLLILSVPRSTSEQHLKINHTQ